MEEPPSKRQRRTDSSTMWDQSETSKPNGDHKDERVESERLRKQPNKQSLGRNDQSSVMASRTDRSKEREREREPDSDRDRDRRRWPHDEKERHWLRKEDKSTKRRRSHSRSPMRELTSRNNGLREITPPRGIRTREPRERPLYAGESVGLHPRDSSPVMKSSTSRKSHKTSETNGKVELEADMLHSDRELENLMIKTMGFGKFRSTKNTKVPGNDKLYGVRKEKKVEYRQYMNRVGGFNRPLSPTR